EGQALPAGPKTLAGDRVILGADALATLAPPDRGFFDYTSYDRSALRMVQVDLTGSAVVSDHFTVLGDIRTQNFETPPVLALYARVRPWTARAADIQIGRIPPTFGAFSRRAYDGNVLIGYPLAYQYLTSLRANAVPANADELLAMRGRGWRSTF